MLTVFLGEPTKVDGDAQFLVRAAEEYTEETHTSPPC